MTPAIALVRKAGIVYRVHEYTHEPRAASFGEEAADALGISRARVFKTLLAMLNSDSSQLAVAVVPVARRLNLKAFAAACRAKRAELADSADAERVTGYVVGGISPLGQKRRLPLVLDASALRFETVFVSAGRRGLELELAPKDLMRLSAGIQAAIAS